MLMTIEKFSAIQKKNDYLAWVAVKHHRTHKNKKLEFDRHYFQQPIFYDKNPQLVFIKSTQNGITEYLLCRAISHSITGLSIFYVLPTYELVKRFVRNRMDKTMHYTDYYRQLEKATQEQSDYDRSDSLTLRDIGKGNIAFVGSKSEIAFTEFPADEVIIDEFDECDQKNIKMAWERMSNSEYRWQVKVSNPTFKGKGIDAEYRKSDQKEWYIQCECGEWTTIDWFRHIVRKIGPDKYVIRDKEWKWDSGRDISPICEKCGRQMNRYSPGYWVPGKASSISGYRITKMFTGTVPIVEIMDRFSEGLVNPTSKQRFYNGDLGKAYTDEGSSVTEDMIMRASRDYMPGPDSGLIVAGVDVGSFYNFIIQKMLPSGVLKTLKVGKCMDTKELYWVLREFRAKVIIVDGLPETREMKRLQRRFKWFFLCYFGNVKADKIDPLHRTITVDRTMLLDSLKEGILTNGIIYPKNIGSDREFIDHMTCSVRMFTTRRNEDTNGKISDTLGRYVWTEGSDPDHYFLASGYALLAKRLVVFMRKINDK